MSTGTAYLNNIGDITLFKFGDTCIQFKSPKILKKYLRVKSRRTTACKVKLARRFSSELAVLVLR